MILNLSSTIKNHILLQYYSIFGSIHNYTNPINYPNILLKNYELKDFQKKTLEKMIYLEEIPFYQSNDKKQFFKFSIYSDPSNYDKILTLLSLITNDHNINDKPMQFNQCCSQLWLEDFFFNLKPTLIIVNTNTFYKWKKDINEHTYLNTLFINSHKAYTQFSQNIYDLDYLNSFDIILLQTNYLHNLNKINKNYLNKLKFKRLIMDDVETLVSPGKLNFNYNFLWLTTDNLLNLFYSLLFDDNYDDLFMTNKIFKQFNYEVLQNYESELYPQLEAYMDNDYSIIDVKKWIQENTKNHQRNNSFIKENQFVIKMFSSFLFDNFHLIELLPLIVQNNLNLFDYPISKQIIPCLPNYHPKIINYFSNGIYETDDMSIIQELNLPIQKYNKRDKEEIIEHYTSENKLLCPICYQNIERYGLVVDCCNKVYHLNCITQNFYYDYEKRCPYCRTSINNNFAIIGDEENQLNAEDKISVIENLIKTKSELVIIDTENNSDVEKICIKNNKQLQIIPSFDYEINQNKTINYLFNEKRIDVLLIKSFDNIHYLNLKNPKFLILNEISNNEIFLLCSITENFQSNYEFYICNEI